jgi:hypothetical protein
MAIKDYFPLPLKGAYIGGGKWKLTEPFEYRDNPLVITVPVGFITDGASIPRFAWGLIGSPWSGRYSRAAVVHDWGYFKQAMPRLTVDRIFLQGMRILGVPRWKRILMYAAVRAFAWKPWNDYKRK